MLSIDKMKSILVQFAFLLMILGCGYVGLKYLVPFMMPFLIAWLFATIIHGAAVKVESYLVRKNHRKTLLILGKKGITKIILVIFYVSIAAVLIAFISWIVEWATGLPETVTQLYNTLILPIFSQAELTMTARTTGIDIEILTNFREFFMQFMSSAGDVLSTFVGSISRFATNIIKGVPNFIWSTVICLIATAFFAVDYSKINCVVGNLIPSEHRDNIVGLVKSALGTVPKFLRGYALVLCITFAEVFVWLLILRVEKPLLIAFLIAILDILPILGTGTVVIPWSIFSLLTGDIGMGIALAAMYASITVIRQYIEPKIIGHEIGVYPIITLLSMFIGQRLFGLGGLLGVPIIAAVSINEFRNYAEQKGGRNEPNAFSCPSEAD